MNKNFSKKYLKYKSKYFNLKKKLEGGESSLIGKVIFYNFEYYLIKSMTNDIIYAQKYNSDSNDWNGPSVTLNKNDNFEVFDGLV